MKFIHKKTKEEKHEEELEKLFDEFLDKNYNEVELYGNKYSVSYFFKNYDPIYYYKRFQRFLSSNYWEKL